MIHRVVLGTATGANEGEHKGWVMGPFMHADALAHDHTHEIKLWHYQTNPEYGVKGFHGTEFIVIYGGRLRLTVFFEDGAEREFVIDGANRDYIILPPHRKQVTAEVCPAFGVTVRVKQEMR